MVIDSNFFQLPVFLQQMMQAGGHTFPGHPSENHVCNFFKEEEYIGNFILEKKKECPGLFTS